VPPSELFRAAAPKKTTIVSETVRLAQKKTVSFVVPPSLSEDTRFPTKLCGPA